MNILVIDDDEEVRDMIRKMLMQGGHSVVSASNGAEGLLSLQNNLSVELVITDLIMPEKEGVETIFELKKDYPDMKIVAISGGGIGSAEPYLKMARVVGADATLNKPFLTKELLDIVDRLS